MSIERIVGVARWALIALLGIGGAAHAMPRIPQLAEDNATTRYVKDAGPLGKPVTRICEKGAKWIRVGFGELTLDRYDSLVLVSERGDRYTFEGTKWNGRSFHSRALRGGCVEIQPYFGDAESG